MYRLIRPIDNSQTEIEVKEFITRDIAPESGLIEIDSEIIKYGNSTAHKFIDCIRAYSGTSAASHTKNSEVDVKDIKDTGSNNVSVKVFTLSLGETVNYTLENPTNPGRTQVVNISHSADSLGTLTVNGGFIGVGESKEFTWDTVSWVVETDATGGGGVTQLTGDVIAGPGSGSQAATVSSLLNGEITLASGPNTKIYAQDPQFGGLTSVTLASKITTGFSPAVILYQDDFAIDMYSDQSEIVFDDVTKYIRILPEFTEVAYFDVLGLKVINGGTGTPSISPSSDPTSGLYFNAASTNITSATQQVASFDDAAIAFVVDGANVEVDILPTKVEFTIGSTVANFNPAGLAIIPGSASTPTIFSLTDPTTGISISESDGPSIIYQGTQVAAFSSVQTDIAGDAGFNFELQLKSTGGTQGAFLFTPTASIQAVHSSTRVDLNSNGTTDLRVDNDSTAGNTRLLVYDVDNGTLERVSVGVADSGGVGFKVLRIPN